MKGGECESYKSVRRRSSSCNNWFLSEYVSEGGNFDCYRWMDHRFEDH